VTSLFHLHGPKRGNTSISERRNHLQLELPPNIHPPIISPQPGGEVFFSQPLRVFIAPYSVSTLHSLTMTSPSVRNSSQSQTSPYSFPFMSPLFSFPHHMQPEILFYYLYEVLTFSQLSTIAVSPPCNDLNSTLVFFLHFFFLLKHITLARSPIFSPRVFESFTV